MKSRPGNWVALGVDLPDHPRADDLQDDYFAALGLYAGVALPYCKRHNTDGIVRRSAPFLRRKGAAKLVRRLLDVGLFREHADGYEVWNYASWNETREEVEERRSLERAKKKAQRDALRAKLGMSVVPGDSHGTPAGHGTSVPGDSRGSPSSSLSLNDQERDPVTDRKTVRADAPTLGPPPETLEITEAFRARCVMSGAPEPTPTDMAACLAHYRAKGVFAADWIEVAFVWMCREKRIAARAGGGRARGAPLQARSAPRTTPAKAPEELKTHDELCGCAACAPRRTAT